MMFIMSLTDYKLDIIKYDLDKNNDWKYEKSVNLKSLKKLKNNHIFSWKNL